MRPVKRRVLPKTTDGRLDDRIETAKAHFRAKGSCKGFAQRVRAKGEHPCRVFNQQFGFQKPRLRGMLKNRCNVNVLAALTHLFLVRQHLLWWTRSDKWCTHRGHSIVNRQEKWPQNEEIQANHHFIAPRASNSNMCATQATLATLLSRASLADARPPSSCNGWRHGCRALRQSDPGSVGAAGSTGCFHQA